MKRSFSKEKPCTYRLIHVHVHAQWSNSIEADLMGKTGVSYNIINFVSLLHPLLLLTPPTLCANVSFLVSSALWVARSLRWISISSEARSKHDSLSAWRYKNSKKKN